MASQTRIMTAAQDLGTLRELAELIKNPKAITEAHEEARKQQALTEDEARKTAEAKDFIAKYNQLEKDLKAREDKLAADKITHAQEAAESQVAFKAESERLAIADKELSDKIKAHTESQKQLLADRKNLEAEKAQHQQEFKDMLKKLEAKAASDDKLRIANEARAVNLASQEEKLRAKAAIYKQAEAV